MYKYNTITWKYHYYMVTLYVLLFYLQDDKTLDLAEEKIKKLGIVE